MHISFVTDGPLSVGFCDEEEERAALALVHRILRIVTKIVMLVLLRHNNPVCLLSGWGGAGGAGWRRAIC
jgi:hypothetical protein